MRLLIFITTFIISVTVFGQIDNSLFDSYKPIDANDSNKLWLSIENQNFLHNNEYFNNLYDGITYLGASLAPTLIYQANTNLRIQAGWYFLKYSGRDVFSRSVPWILCQYRISQNLDLFMGNIHGTVQHKLIEPLYSFDRHYSGQPETGLQFIGKFKHLEGDMWLNWEKFILPGDPFKEEFTMAGTYNVLLYNPENKLKISIPLQWLAAHKGGQMETSTEPLQTYFNTALGLDVKYHSFTKTKNYIGLNSYLASYYDASSHHVQYYSEGYGILSNLYAKIGKFDIVAGYWYGEHFIAPRGEPLFQSVSQKYTIWWEPNKQLILNKFQFHQPIGKGIDLAVRFESYYDILQKNMDFSYSLFLNIKEDFFLKKLKM
jgi:hypothetical protein